MPAELPLSAQALMVAWAAAVGAVVGSFLNVVIARVPAGQSVVRPRSRCPRCGAGIAWYDNVPVLSWLWLRARCRRCGAPISARYPLVEILGALAGALAMWRHGPSAAALVELALVSLLLALAFIDLDTWLLPHALTWPLLGAGLLAGAARLTPAGGFSLSALGAAVGFGAFALIAIVGERLLKKEALGWGDVWLLGGLGAWLGVQALLPVILLASVQGSVVGLLLMALGKAQPGPGDAPAPDPTDPDADWVPPRNAVPFGPFLALAALEWLYLSDRIARVVPVLEVFR